MTSCNDHNKCIQYAFNQAEDICLKHDLRFTDLRKKVFSIILQNHKPAKAYDILTILQQEDPAAKPATVYRTLDFLLEHGLIHKLHIANSYVTCSHPLAHKRCSFLICSKCNEVQECCDTSLTSQIKQVGERNNFQIEDATVEISGLCNLCVA